MVIDHLEAGGAQRQFCLLATGLRRSNFQVEILTLREDSFFEHLLVGEPKIPVIQLAARNRFHLYFRLRRQLRQFKPAVVVSFLSWPNLLVELSSIPRRTFSIIASERNMDTSSSGIRRRLRYLLHRLADSIVSNSYAQARVIARVDHLLKERTTVIPNAVDTSYFRPPARKRAVRIEAIRLLVVARLTPQKNPLRLVEAINVLRSYRKALAVHIDWYGKLPVHPSSQVSKWARSAHDRELAHFQAVKEAIATHSLGDRIQFHGPVADVRPLYHTADALCLPSLYEGYPNVVAEAMACGLPVLASDVGDTSLLVADGQSGFLFDPLSVNEIVDAIVRFSELSESQREDFGIVGRSVAERLLSIDHYVDRYARLIQDVTTIGDAQ